MAPGNVFYPILIGTLYLFCVIPGTQTKSNLSFVREEIFNDKYRVSWEPNFEEETVTFQVTVGTTGFVGFGLSNTGGMTGADIVIGGVNPDGTSYFQDYHAISNSFPLLDPTQDWHLLNAYENSTHTHLTFSRKFDTCDENDIPITEGSTHFIWSFGETDVIGYHGTNRGASTVNILDPPMPATNLSSFDEWKITKTMVMPEVDTTYWCTIHKRPQLDGERHVVGFGPFTPSAEAVKHTHHLVVFECTAPDGQDPDEVFGPYLDHPGEECFFANQTSVMHSCYRVLFVWATGGKVTLFPEDVGFPINEPGHESTTSYVKMELHYDNPDLLQNVAFESGITVYHTPELRPIEAGLLLVDHRIWPTHLIPPRAVDYVTVGHCSPVCTQNSLPPSGINIFNVFLHSHLAGQILLETGRKLRLRHFRDGVELPWIANDEHYNFDFQQSRPLRNHVKVLPGDQLSYECGTDTSDRNTTTLAGLSTRHEMCESFSWYYPRANFMACGSYYHETEQLFHQFGVNNVTWEFSHFDPTVTSPEIHQGKLWSQVLDEQEWTEEEREAIEKQLRYSQHQMYSCGDGNTFVSYPEPLEEYIPPQTCF